MMASNQMQCATCSKTENEENKLKSCAICGTVTYCCVECQRSDWPSHKRGCTEAGCLKLIAAVHENDKDNAMRLAKTKRILNGKVDYTPPATSDFPHPHAMGNWTALHECVRQKNTEIMQVLLDNGAKVEIKDVDGETPLFVSSSSGHPELVKTLLKAGANPNSQSEDGWTCLMVAARDGDYESCGALLDSGASLSGSGDMFGRSALDIAAQQASGQGLRMKQGESPEQALEKSKKVHSLLSRYANR